MDVRIGDEVVSGQTLEAVERMVTMKIVRADTPVRVDDGPWRPARQIDALRGLFVVDAWDAWDELDDVDEEAVLSSSPKAEAVKAESVDAPPPVSVEPEKEAAPEGEAEPERGVEADEPDTDEALEVVEPDEPDTDDVPQVIPEPLLEELDPTEVEELPAGAIDRRGQVIDFPVRPFPSHGGGKRGGAEPARNLPVLPPNLPEFPPRRDAGKLPPLPSGPPARWFALLAIIAVAAMGVFGMVAYVNSTAGWTSERAPLPPPDVEPSVDGPEVVEDGEPEPMAAVDDELRDLERELRSTMRVDIVDLCTGDAEDIHGALLVELSRLKVQVATVDSPVYRWSESTTPCPEVLDLRVTLNDRGQKSRDLASVALVVGKYIEHHDWQMREFQLSWRSDDGTLRGTEVDPNRVRLFWGAAIGLDDFLE